LELPCCRRLHPLSRCQREDVEPLFRLRVRTVRWHLFFFAGFFTRPTDTLDTPLKLQLKRRNQSPPLRRGELSHKETGRQSLKYRRQECVEVCDQA
jgi:hypothetical protein